MPLLMPRRTKYRNQHRGTNRGVSTRGSRLAFGEFGLKAVGRGILTYRQIEAARKAISHKTKRGGKLWIRVFPSKPITKKPAETRMGSGKSPLDHYAAVVKPGKILFELAGISEEMAQAALKRAADKLPIKTKFISHSTMLGR